MLVFSWLYMSASALDFCHCNKTIVSQLLNCVEFPQERVDVHATGPIALKNGPSLSKPDERKTDQTMETK